MLPWKPSFTIGVTELDVQHKMLFKRAARFEGAVHARECGFRPSRSAIPADADRPFWQGDHRERCAAG
jgi:hypothetical protein